jgi:hypothetical protein
MTAVQLKCPDMSPRQASGRSTAAVAREGATVTAPFRPLDPDIVSEAIPAFFIGRNKEGFWVARDVNGRIGGIFLRESSALSFARKHRGAAGCATVYLSERFELDLENQGNPLVVKLASLIAFARHPRAQLTALIGKMTGAIRRSTKDC